jgi:hypothetical protein
MNQRRFLQNLSAVLLSAVFVSTLAHTINNSDQTTTVFAVILFAGIALALLFAMLGLSEAGLVIASAMLSVALAELLYGVSLLSPEQNVSLAVAAISIGVFCSASDS